MRSSAEAQKPGYVRRPDPFNIWVVRFSRLIQLGVLLDQVNLAVTTVGCPNPRTNTTWWPRTFEKLRLVIARRTAHHPVTIKISWAVQATTNCVSGFRVPSRTVGVHLANAVPERDRGGFQRCLSHITSDANGVVCVELASSGARRLSHPLHEDYNHIFRSRRMPYQFLCPIISRPSLCREFPACASILRRSRGPPSSQVALPCFFVFPGTESSPRTQPSSLFAVVPRTFSIGVLPS